MTPPCLKRLGGTNNQMKGTRPVLSCMRAPALWQTIFGLRPVLAPLVLASDVPCLSGVRSGIPPG